MSHMKKLRLKKQPEPTEVLSRSGPAARYTFCLFHKRGKWTATVSAMPGGNRPHGDTRHVLGAYADRARCLEMCQVLAAMIDCQTPPLASLDSVEASMRRLAAMEAHP